MADFAIRGERPRTGQRNHQLHAVLARADVEVVRYLDSQPPDADVARLEDFDKAVSDDLDFDRMSGVGFDSNIRSFLFHPRPRRYCTLKPGRFAEYSRPERRTSLPAQEGPTMRKPH